MAVLDRLYQRPAVLWFFYALLMMAVGITSGFAILANDAFPLLFQAERLSLSDPITLYNGFFPIGYPLLLKGLLLFGRENIHILSVAINILASLGFLLFGKQLLDRLDSAIPWKLVALIAAAFLPEVLRSVMTIRPDFIVMTIALAAFVSITKEKYALAGLLLGSAFLFRSHVLVLIASVVVGLLVIKQYRPAIMILLSALPFVFFQGILNLAAGESFLASSQSFNIAKLMYGADWKSEHAVTISSLELIASDPGRFITAWMDHLLTEWYFTLIFIAGLFAKRTRMFASIGLLYCLIVATGGSPRGTLPIQPLAVFILFAMLASQLDRLLDRSRLIPAVVILLIIGGASVMLFTAANRSKARIERYEEVARGLGLAGSSDASKVLTDDFSLYFPQQDNAAPRVNGGWAIIGMPAYREWVPQFTESDPVKLRTKLREHGVETIVLAQPTQDPDLLNTISRDTTAFVRMQDLSGYAVYTVR